MLLKLIVIFIMLGGLVLTLMPRYFGTLVILAATVLYAAAVDSVTVPPWVMGALVVLTFTAEVGGRILRVYMTKRANLSRRFCVNSTMGSIGGVLAADALLGPILGLLVWELIAGKTLSPRWNTVGRVLLRLAAAAALRFACGLLMIILVLVYIMG